MGNEILEIKESTIQKKFYPSRVYLHFKRVIDFVCSLLALIILSPLFLILFIAIKLDSKGPVLFKQKRVGIHKTHFVGNKLITTYNSLCCKEMKVA
jgi:lipopolysaccharide/colanic/teichoic acid biosynthesis glycosyltransferase